LNIAFRADASESIGIGHLIRCLALAEELKNKNHSCFFVTKIQNKDLIERIEKNHKHLQINPNANLEQDNKELLNFSNQNKIDWIITDHYDINSEYIQKLKNKNYNVLSIDDNAIISYHSDIVLNQNIGAEKLKYSNEEYTKFLLGPKYALIRNQLLVRDKKTQRSSVKKILIMLGGTDEDNIILKIIKSIKEIKDVEFLVIIGPLNPHYNELKKYIDSEKINVKLIRSPENLADFYLDSDIAISAGGSSCYEFSYFGIPNIIITLAKNQVKIAKELDRQKISIYIGDIQKIDFNNLRKKLKELISNSSIRNTMSKNGKKLVDGKGKERTIDFMERFN